jgi:hypothetical protein
MTVLVQELGEVVGVARACTALGVARPSYYRRELHFFAFAKYAAASRKKLTSRSSSWVFLRRARSSSSSALLGAPGGP